MKTPTMAELETISRDIKECELHSMGCFVPVTFKSLEWKKHGKRFRIMMGDRPLCEQPIALRVQGYEDLRGLFDLIADEIAAAAAARSTYDFSSFFNRTTKKEASV